MGAQVVITAVGEDRPGLVGGMSRFIFEHGCNLEDSRMAILGGEFAMLILVSGEPEALRGLVEGLEAESARSGLAIQAKHTEGLEAKPRQGALPYDVCAYSMDHPGIVQRVTSLLADRKVNIRALETRLSHAAHTGQPLFSLHAQVEVPAGESVAGLRRALEEIGALENIDIEMKRSG